MGVWKAEDNFRKICEEELQREILFSFSMQLSEGHGKELKRFESLRRSQGMEEK
ncbi:hypothetical protein [Thermococcus sp. M39]|uniref:hypothetical protein n=1 Tax=Thermococcus sp. M39 TaxID=1638262 RepID=UPI00143BF019|nr:hypothetical protein [Thermococcus sp. M39]